MEDQGKQLAPPVYECNFVVDTACSCLLLTASLCLSLSLYHGHVCLSHPRLYLQSTHSRVL